MREKLADAAYALFGELADEVRDVGFLCWGAPAGDYGGEEDCEADEVVAEVGEEEGEGFAVDEEGGVFLAAEEIEMVLSIVFALELGDRVDVLASGDEFG